MKSDDLTALIALGEGITPGEWWAAGYSSVVGSPVMAQPDKTKNSQLVCGVHGPATREETEANAKAIAAVPRYIAALKAAQERERVLREALDQAFDFLGGVDDAVDIRQVILDALASTDTGAA